MLRQPPDILITTPESLFLLLTSRARAILALGRDGDRRRDPRPGGDEARRAPRALARAARGGRRPAAAADRPLGDAAAARGGGALPGGRRGRADVDAAAGHDRRRRGEEGLRPAGRGAGRGHVAAGRGRSSRRRARSPRGRRASSSAARSGPRSTRASSSSCARTARRSSSSTAAAWPSGWPPRSTSSPASRSPAPTTARSPASSGCEIEDALKAGRLPALVATSSLELGHRHGRGRPRGPDRDAALGRERDAADRPGQPPGGGGLARGHLPQVPRRPARERGDHAGHEAGRGRGDARPREPARRARPAARGDGGAGRAHGGRALRARPPRRALRRARPGAVRGRARHALRALPLGRVRGAAAARRLGPAARHRARPREGAQRLVVAERRHHPRPRASTASSSPTGEGAGRRVGELDEEMVFESRAGEVFVLGASSWRITEITRDRVLVRARPRRAGQDAVLEGGPRRAAGGAGPRHRPAHPRAARGARGTRRRRGSASEHDLDPQAAREPARLPRRAARGDRRRCPTTARSSSSAPATRWGTGGCASSRPGAAACTRPGRSPSRRSLRRAGRGRGRDDLERRRDRAPPARARAPARRRRPPARARGDRGPRRARAGRHEPVRRALPRGGGPGAAPARGAGPGQRTPLWMQRKRAHDLLQVAARYPSFPIVLEAYRECLRDVFDLPGLVALAAPRAAPRDPPRHRRHPDAVALLGLAPLRLRRQLPLRRRRARSPSGGRRRSPWTRRSCASCSARRSCGSCSTGDALAELELALQCLDASAPGHEPDRLHDLLLRLGDLTLDEIAARVAPAARRRRRGGRAGVARRARARAAGDPRSGSPARSASPPPRTRGACATRSASRPRRACPPPSSSRQPRRAARPRLALRPHPRPLHARPTSPAATALGRGARRSPRSARCAKDGRVLEGEFRPGGRAASGAGRTCSRTLRRRSLAALRKQVEPAEPDGARAGCSSTGRASARGPRPARAAAPTRSSTWSSSSRARSFPASILERDVLPARLPGYRPEDLDTLSAAGEVVWVGLGALGDRDGRIALFLADDLPLLLPPRPRGAAEATCTNGIREHLGPARGVASSASSSTRPGGGLARPVARRAVGPGLGGRGHERHPGGAARLPRRARARGRSAAAGSAALPLAPAGPALGGGPLEPARRSPRRAPIADREDEGPRRAAPRRATASSPATRSPSRRCPGGFSAVYPVLRALEEAGRIRRGYFVAGLGGLQFADPGALERLRALREPRPPRSRAAVVLAATDPANPYGAALPWPPERRTRASQRAAGAARRPRGRSARGRGRAAAAARPPLLPDDEPARSRAAQAAAQALRRWCEATARPALGWAVGEGEALAEGPLAPFLAEAGFVRSGPGFRVTPRDSAGPGPQGPSV